MTMEEFVSTAKTAVLVAFFALYCAIFLWLYVKKSDGVEEHKNIPFKEK